MSVSARSKVELSNLGEMAPIVIISQTDNKKSGKQFSKLQVDIRNRIEGRAANRNPLNAGYNLHISPAERRISRTGQSRIEGRERGERVVVSGKPVWE